jgi:hypothetical protein
MIAFKPHCSHPALVTTSPLPQNPAIEIHPKPLSKHIENIPLANDFDYLKVGHMILLF